MLRQRLISLSLLIAGAAMVGCGDGRPARVPVSGKVLIDGKPLSVGAVRFKPAEGRVATGEIGPDGAFSLSTFEPGDGAVTGRHEVTVHSTVEIGADQIQWNVPKKYQRAKTSELVQQIDGPTDSVVIELTWGDQKGPFTERISLGE